MSLLSLSPGAGVFFTRCDGSMMVGRICKAAASIPAWRAGRRATAASSSAMPTRPPIQKKCSTRRQAPAWSALACWRHMNQRRRAAARTASLLMVPSWPAFRPPRPMCRRRSAGHPAPAWSASAIFGRNAQLCQCHQRRWQRHRRQRRSADSRRCRLSLDADRRTSISRRLAHGQWRLHRKQPVRNGGGGR